MSSRPAGAAPRRPLVSGGGPTRFVLLGREPTRRRPVVLDHLVVIDAVVRRATFVAVDEVAGALAPHGFILIVLPAKQAPK